MKWSDLPPAEQRRIRDGSQMLARLAYEYATPVIVATDGDDSAYNSASGFVVELGGRPYLATADHVVAKYRARREASRYTYLQAGQLGIDALGRIAHSDPVSDIAFVDLVGLEVDRTRSTIYRPVGPWPPDPVRVGDAVQFCGFPIAYRKEPAPNEVDFESLPGFASISTVGRAYCTCQIEREHVVGFGPPGELPPASAFRGLSGGPVLLFGSLSYPIVGLVSEVFESFDILRFATLDTLPKFYP